MIGLLLRIGAVLLLCVPLSLIVTLLTTPFWSWLEANYGIESVGHSGPAEWCYVVVYAVMNLLVFAMLWYRWERAKTAQTTKG